jgi:SAM-dependent methyltransferase
VQLTLTLVDLGSTPPSNAYLTEQALQEPERRFPLRVLTCEQCWLVQTEDFAGRDVLFAEDYAYFSSYSSSWLAHAERYVADAVRRYKLNERSHVVEIAANDGYLLQYVQARGIPCTGVEPTASTAAAARAKGIRIVQEFFGETFARSFVRDHGAADLMVANNVLAHVPDINDFVRGFSIALKEAGVATFEFPHLLRLIAENQFDTVYHEHFSYLSLTAVERIFAKNGLAVFDVEELDTHGGSLRVFAQRSDSAAHESTPNVRRVLQEEDRAGIRTPGYYRGLQASAERIRADLNAFLAQARREGKQVVGYGAAAKGNTLLNYAGVTTEHIPWVVDRNPAKVGKYLPGSRIPIVDEARMTAEKPAYILILPWNLRREISEQLSYVREWGGRFVWAIPQLRTD